MVDLGARNHEYKLDVALKQYYIIPDGIEKGMSIPYQYQQGNPKSSDSGNLSLSI